MPTCSFGHVIYDAIVHRNLGYEEVIQLVNAAGKADGEPNARYNRTALTRWLTGTIPPPKTQRWIGSALDIPPAKLAAAADAQRAQQQANREALASTHDSTTQQDRSETPDLQFDVAEQSAMFDQWADSTNMGATTIDQVADDIRALVSDYAHESPENVFRHAAQLRKRLIALLHGHQHPKYTRDLYFFTGQLSALLAWISGDLGHQRYADQHGRTAWTCAELADHDGLRACALVTQGKTAFWQGQYERAAEVAERGLRYAPRSTMPVLLACRAASSWAQLGAEEPARTALRLAHDGLERATLPDDMGGVFTCADARYENYVALVELRLGQSTQALTHAEQARLRFARGESRHFGTEAQVDITMAAAHLAVHDLDATIRALTPLLKLPPEQRLDTLVRRMAPLLSMLADRRLAHEHLALQARELVDEFCTNAVAPAPDLRALAPARILLT